MKGRQKRKGREKERLHRPSQTEHSCHIYPYNHVWHNVTVPNSVVVKVPSSVVISSICVNNTYKNKNQKYKENIKQVAQLSPCNWGAQLHH